MPDPVAHPTVFYSWQSDAPNACNRGLIKEALEIALKAIALDASIELSPRLDHDTVGVPGSPDIGQTILAKIDAASVFVADVSLVLGDSASPRRSPNPNVLFELGYAWKSLQHDRVILVVNTHFGSPEALPFDLRSKRALAYASDPSSGERAPARKELASKLEAALRLTLGGLPKLKASTSRTDSALEAIRGTARGRDVVVRTAASGLVTAAFDIGAELRAAPVDDDAARRVFELLAAPAGQLAEFASLVRELVIVEDASSLDGVLAALGVALDGTWVAPGFTGPIPRPYYDFTRIVSMWLLLATVASIIAERRYALLRFLLDHRYHPRNPEHGRPRDEGRAFSAFAQDVKSSAVWRPSAHEKYRSPIGAGLKRLADAVTAVDAHAPTVGDIIAADALLGFASLTEVNGTSHYWHPQTALLADDERFPWFRELARRKLSAVMLPAIGYSDVETARAEWTRLCSWVAERVPFPPYEEMKPDVIASLE